MRITFLDTETSDILDRNPNAEIIAYTLQIWENGQRFPQQTLHLWPRGPVNPEAAEKNGYSPEEWHRRGAQRAFDWQDATNFQQTLTDAIVGGHNTKFDLDMVYAHFDRAGIQRPKTNYRVVDTQAMAQGLVALGVIASASLVNVSKYFGIDVSKAHTSAGDIDMTIDVWENLLRIKMLGLRALGVQV